MPISLMVLNNLVRDSRAMTNDCRVVREILSGPFVGFVSQSFQTRTFHALPKSDNILNMLHFIQKSWCVTQFTFLSSLKTLAQFPITRWSGMSILHFELLEKCPLSALEMIEWCPSECLVTAGINSTCLQFKEVSVKRELTVLRINWR